MTMAEPHSDPCREWERSYASPGFRHKNEYPAIEVVSFIMRAYGTVSDRSSVRVLELGCGWGNNLRFLKEKGFSFAGIDFSPSAVDHCSRTVGNVVCGDIADLPFEGEHFDCVIDRMAIQHNPEAKIRTIVDETHRVLKPGGQFFSLLIEKADYDHSTTFLTRADIADLLGKFAGHEIDYAEMSSQGGRRILRMNVVVAKK